MIAEAISFGAGVNSVAMTIMLVDKGWRGPIVFADPGAEYPETYCYLDMFNERWLRPRGLEITTISPATMPELYPPSYRRLLETRCLECQVVPLVAIRWCTIEYKRLPIRKHTNAETYLLGFSMEEAWRAERRQDDTTVFPLIDRLIDRDGCKDIIRGAGLPLPRKSGCFFCPFQRRAEWRALYDQHPDLFQRAVDMEAGARERNPRRPPVQLGMSLRLPLAVARDRWDNQLELPEIPLVEYEYYQMCECRV